MTLKPKSYACKHAHLLSLTHTRRCICTRGLAHGCMLRTQVHKGADPGGRQGAPVPHPGAPPSSRETRAPSWLRLSRSFAAAQTRGCAVKAACLHLGGCLLALPPFSALALASFRFPGACLLSLPWQLPPFASLAVASFCFPGSCLLSLPTAGASCPLHALTPIARCPGGCLLPSPR